MHLALGLDVAIPTHSTTAQLEAWEAKEPSKHEIRYSLVPGPRNTHRLLESGNEARGYAAEPEQPRARTREPGEGVRRSDRGGEDVVSGPRGTLGTAGLHRER